MAIRNLSMVILIFLCCASCDQNRVFDGYSTISGGWSKEEPIQFVFEPPDTIQKYNMFLNVRNTNEYPYNNLFLITTLEYPNGRRDVDTLEYVMAAPDGKWLGKGFNDVKESKLWYSEGVRFRESGNYTMSIAQAVRKNGNVQGDSKLVGITEVGVRVEHSQK